MKFGRAKRKPKVDQLDMHQVQKLQRINKQAFEKHKFHQEKEKFLTQMLDKQRALTFESERDRLRAAELKGPLATEAYARKQKLIDMLKDK